MFTETLTAHDDTIGLACEGKLSESDLKRMHALLHERLQETSKLWWAKGLCWSGEPGSPTC